MKKFSTLLIAFFCVVLLQAQTVWTGSLNTDWDETANWSGGIPTTGMSATIPSNPIGGNNPVYDGTPLISFTIQNAGTITFSSLIYNNGMIINYSGGTIIIDDYFINAGTVTFDNDGIFSNNGTFDNYGVFENAFSAEINNNIGSVFNNYGKLTSNGDINNDGIFNNYRFGVVRSTKSLVNNGTITNQGIIENPTGSTFTNGANATLDNQTGSSFSVNGIASNANTIINDGKFLIASSSDFTNTGSITNNDMFDNSGTLNNQSSFTNNGTFVNNDLATLDNTASYQNNGTIENSVCGVIIQNANNTIGGTILSEGLVYELAGSVNETNGDLGQTFNNLNQKKAPVAGCRSGAFLQLDQNGTATLDPALVDKGSYGSCGAQVASVTVSPNTFGTNDIGQQVVTLTVTDDLGFTSTCEGIVNVVEYQEPIAAVSDPDINLNCPQDITVATLAGGLSAEASWITPTVTTNCVPTICETRTIINTDHCNNSESYGFYMVINGENSRYTFSNGTFVENLDGTAQITGQIKNNSNQQLKFNVDITLSGRTTSIPTGSPKAHSCYDANTGDWYYYTTTTGRLTGTGNLTSGAVLEVSRRGPAFQMGDGANQTTANLTFGGSGWLDIDVVSQPNSSYTLPSTIVGDINVQLTGDKLACRDSAGAGSISISETTTTTPNSSTDCSQAPSSISGYIYMGQYNGSKYFCTNTNSLTWHQAKTQAEAIGGYLAVVNSYGENEFIRNSMVADYVWIGYTDEASEGNFRWIGDNSNYTNWNSGEPNNNGTYGEDYTRLLKSSGKWTDRDQYFHAEGVIEIPCPNATCELTITFNNNGDCAANIYWLDNGTEVFYRTLAAGQSYNQHSFEGHKWRIINENNTASTDYTASACVNRIVDINVTCTSPIENTDPNLTVQQISGSPSGSLFPVGTTQIAYEAKDDCGNLEICTFDVVVEETPSEITLTSCPSDISITTLPGAPSVVVNYNTPTATTTCFNNGLEIERLAGFESGTEFPIGTTVVSYSAVDSCGNFEACTFNVTVVPTPAELTITNCPETITLSAPFGASSTTTTWDEPTASTTCYTGNVTIRQIAGPTNGGAIPTGTSQIIYIISDDCNNTQICVFDIVVENCEAPGTACDDGDECTINDVQDGECNCVGTFQDADNDTVCDLDDICPDGDDTIDLDRDGIPDDCDNVLGNENCDVIPGGYCTSSGSSSKLWISQVTFENISKSSSKENYADFTSHKANLTAGESYSITLTPQIGNGPTPNVHWTVWIDFNQDGDFNDAGEQVVRQANGTQTLTATINVPADAFVGGTRMRVSAKRNSFSNSCEGISRGEVEDYGICMESGCTEVGQSCDDNDACTINDTIDANCNCTGTYADSDNDGVCDADDACEGSDDAIDTDLDGIPDGCDNAICNDVTDAGEIAGDETTCGDFGPITSVATPSGGTGDIEYQWLASTTGCPTSITQAIPGENGETYNPGTLTETTYFVRCSRRAGCDNWFNGESNCIVKTVDADSDNDGICDALDICPGNDDATDTDGDGIPDGCDDCSLAGTACDDGSACTINDKYDDACNCKGDVQDADNDGVCDADDICAGHDDTIDTDGDGTPDGCDEEPLCDNYTAGGAIGPNQGVCTGTEAALVGDLVSPTGGSGATEIIWLISTTSGGAWPTSSVDDIFAGNDPHWQVIPDATELTYNPGVLTETTYLIRCARRENCNRYMGESNVAIIAVDNCTEPCTMIGQPCDDGSACTINDKYDDACNCKGDVQDTDNDGVCDADDICEGYDDTTDTDGDGIPDGCDDCSLAGTPCDDNSDCTINDTYDADCNCKGDVQDADNDGVCDADDICEGHDDAIDTDGDGTPDGCDDCSLAGTPCNDNNDCTIDDKYNDACNCVGTLQDSDNDGVCDADDVCAGHDDATDTDGDGIPDGCDDCSLAGTPCNDNNDCTINDTYDADCNCKGDVQDADNDGVCDADDICEGHDDAIDTDGDGIPDGCDTAESPFCDKKPSGCTEFTLVDIAENTDGSLTYSYKITNNCNYALSNVAFELPYGVVADLGNTYNGEWNTYYVENPTNNPFYSIKFETIGEGIKNGETESFEYTLPSDSPRLNTITVNAKSSTQEHQTDLNSANCGGDLDPSKVGTPCDDGNPCTINDVYDEGCDCQGTFADADADGVCDYDDVCEGHDDNIDTDNNGTPDGCDEIVDPSSCANNKLDNADFENGLASWEVYNAYETSNAYSGNSAVKITNRSGGVYQMVPATSGQAFSLTVWAKTQSYARKAKIELSFYDANGYQITSNRINVDRNTNSYNEYTLSKIAPSGTAYAEAAIWKYSRAGEFYADDICFITNNTNLVHNNSIILSFDAQQENRAVNMNWVTNTEYKNDYFIVERSSDGINYEVFEEVQSSTESTSAINYNGIDENPFIGDNYYRIKQVYVDGTFDYTQERKVRFDIDLEDISVFPNPASTESYINLKSVAGKEGTLYIYNGLGQPVLVQEYEELPADAIRIDLANYNSGVYLITIKVDGNRRITKQLVVNKL